MYVIVMFNILYKASPGTPNMVLVNRKILLIFMEDIWGEGGFKFTTSKTILEKNDVSCKLVLCLQMIEFSLLHFII